MALPSSLESGRSGSPLQRLLRFGAIGAALFVVALAAATVIDRSSAPLPPSVLGRAGQSLLTRAWQLADTRRTAHGFPNPRSLAASLSSQLGVRVVAAAGCGAVQHGRADMVVDTLESTSDTLVLYGSSSAGVDSLRAGDQSAQPYVAPARGCLSQPFSDYAQAAILDQAQAYWLLDRVDHHVTTHDLTGADRRLRFVNASLQPAAAMGGYASFFNGGGSYLDGGQVFDFSGYQPFTIELWADPGSEKGPYQCLISKQSVSAHSDGYTLWLRGSQGLGFNRYGNGTLSTAVYKRGLPAERWSYVVATYDGQTLTLYVDGRRVASGASASESRPNSVPFRVGSASVPGCYYRGGMARLSVYAYALTPSLIGRHFALAQTQQNAPVNPSRKSALGSHSKTSARS